MDKMFSSIPLFRNVTIPLQVVQYRPIELGGAIGKKLERNLYKRTFEPKPPKRPLSPAHPHAPYFSKNRFPTFWR